MKVKLSDIIGAIEMTDQDSDYFLDRVPTIMFRLI